MYVYASIFCGFTEFSMRKFYDAIGIYFDNLNILLKIPISALQNTFS